MRMPFSPESVLFRSSACIRISKSGCVGPLDLTRRPELYRFSQILVSDSALRPLGIHLGGSDISVRLPHIRHRRLQLLGLVDVVHLHSIGVHADDGPSRTGYPVVAALQQLGHVQSQGGTCASATSWIHTLHSALLILDCEFITSHSRHTRNELIRFL
jgi:hypothetical protein